MQQHTMNLWYCFPITITKAYLEGRGCCVFSSPLQMMTNQIYLTYIVTDHSFHLIATLSALRKLCMWTWALSLEYKTYQAHLLILQIGCPSYNLISCRKSLLIQNSSPQIPSAFNKHEIAQKVRNIWRKMITTTTTKKIPKNYHSKCNS